MKKSKIRMVEDFINKGLSLTQKKSTRLFGYRRLSDGIGKLRKEGMDILTVQTIGVLDHNKNGNDYGTYILRRNVKKVTKKFDRKGIKYFIKRI